MSFRLFFAILGMGMLTHASAPAQSARSPAEVARRVDQMLIKEQGSSASFPELCDDATYLGRVSMDLTGKFPDPALRTAFLNDSAAGKRAQLVDRLLRTDAYAVNWGRYWRDVLTYHTPASGNYLRWELFDRWMVEQVRKNRSWGTIVTALVTSEGVNDECAPVNFLTAHFGNTVEIAATTSRVFLGVQLQCAQCHDAKTEPWKREQFHELAAFFGRARIIQHKDVDGTGRGTPYAIEGRGDGQYFMTHKKDPATLIEITPRFLTGEAIAKDATDSQRREALAKLLTSPSNPWFARAYVNRMWTTLMGWGFYPTVTDLGTNVTPRHGDTLALLAKEWTASGYDMPWLFRTITATEAYQRRMQPRPDSDSMAPAAICPQRLRPEQIFEALTRVLGFDEHDRAIPAPAPSTAPAVARHTGLRNMVYQAFKVDPSLPPEEVQGTIPQALLMMNSALVNTYVAATGKTFLADTLQKNMKDEEVVAALYDRTLARRPRAGEWDTCRRYLARVGNRQEAFEDIFWSLVNSTEFLTKR
jgi:hypothetical protein